MKYFFTHVEIAVTLRRPSRNSSNINNWPLKSWKSGERADKKEHSVWNEFTIGLSLYEMYDFATSSVWDFRVFRISYVRLGVKKPKQMLLADRRNVCNVYNCCVIVWIILTRVAKLSFVRHRCENISLAIFLIGVIRTLWKFSFLFFSYYTCKEKRQG